VFDLKLRDWGLLLGAIGTSVFTYGMLVESKRLVIERRTLRLPLWPRRLNGFRVAVLADMHVRGPWSLELAKKAVSIAVELRPDMVVLPGDFVDYWQPGTSELLAQALEPLAMLNGNAVAVPGNHDYSFNKDACLLEPILSSVGVKLLRNEVWEHQGVSWVGIDSAFREHADPVLTMLDLKSFPAIALWHEPDLVDRLPLGCALQISGHSHGGQFKVLPGFAPAHSHLGKRYPEGFYEETPTPLYVSRGIGTTGPPSRFLCPPEVTLLTLMER
jgi:predicted MPP superfamily phosphohydrolase